MLLKHVNNTANVCFQAQKVNVLDSRDVYFAKISPFLYIVYLLIFSILKILDGGFFGKITGQNYSFFDAFVG